ncbi:MAG: hypothetical protein WD063_06200 [Pirellulales bacterium]
MRALVAEVYRRNRVLAATGSLFAILALALVIAIVFDRRELLGVNVWIKPIKFLVSVALYLWTLAWFLAYLERPRWVLRCVAWSAAGLMLIELSCIIFQAARGHTSHFNNATTLDAGIFGIMGLLILLNTIVEGSVLVLFLLPRAVTLRKQLAPAYLWGIRLGLVSTLFSAAIGMEMIGNNQHAVGVPDGGAGLPVLNWSTEAGDLRGAHAITLHGVQLLPWVGYLFSRRPRSESSRAQLAGFSAVVAVYAAVAFWTYWQAIQGLPLVAGAWLGSG